MSDDSYVTNESWLQPSGRSDAIDEIADQFERRAPSVGGAAEFWDDITARRVAREHALAPRSIERRVG